MLDGIDLDVPAGTVFALSAGDAIASVAWCVGIALVGYLWSLSTVKKRA